MLLPKRFFHLKAGVHVAMIYIVIVISPLIQACGVLDLQDHQEISLMSDPFPINDSSSLSKRFRQKTVTSRMQRL